jgi:hypothetical protein
VCEAFSTVGEVDDFGVKVDKNGQGFCWVRYTSDEDAARARDLLGLRMALAKAGLAFAGSLPKVLICSAMRNERKAEKQQKSVSNNTVQELGTLSKTTTNAAVADLWMQELAASYKRQPAMMTQAMMPIQEAAKRGAMVAVDKLAAEMTKATIESTKTRNAIERMEAEQKQIKRSIDDLKRMMTEKKTAQEDAEVEWPTPASAVKHGNGSSMRNAPKRKSRTDGLDEMQKDAVVEMFKQAAERMAATEAGVQALLGMADADDSGESREVLRSMGLIQ